MLYILMFLRDVFIIVNIALSISILCFTSYATMYLQYFCNDMLPFKLPYGVFFLESALLGVGAFVAVCFMLLLSYCVACFVKFLWKTNWWFLAVLLGVYFITNEGINFITYWGKTYNFFDDFFYNPVLSIRSTTGNHYNWTAGILIVGIMLILLLLSIFLLRYFNRKAMDFSNKHDCVEHS